VSRYSNQLDVNQFWILDFRFWIRGRSVEKPTSNPDCQPADPNLKSKIQNLKFGQAWLGETMPTLDELWHKYLRRFALEHWYRFAKQRLYWVHPQLSSTQAAERWSDLMPLLTWQLWLSQFWILDFRFWISGRLVEKLTSNPDYQPADPNLKSKIQNLKLLLPHVPPIPLSKNTHLKKLNPKNHGTKPTPLLLSFR